MCGLFGFCGDPKIIDKNIAKAIQAKVKILGLYNIERGKHSCGVYMDNQVLKGIDNDKLFSDFIQNNQLPDASARSLNYTIIGHTRMATHGTHNYENAHPFVVDNQFILAHNGVIRNIWSLCTKHGINHKDIHVDSLGLAHIINKDGFDVLNEYEGFAALLMAKASEPNSLYVYRGVSKRYSAGAEEEERPLYYMQSEEGIYLSSLEKSLLAISDSGSDKIKQVEGNIVHKFTNGKMTKSKFPVSRDTINIGVNVQTHGGSAAQNYPKSVGAGTTGTKTTSTGTTPTSGTTPTCVTNSKVSSSYPSPISAFEKNIVPMIWWETLPAYIDRFSGRTGVFYQYGRFWIVDNDEITPAHGSYYINKKGIIYPHRSKNNANVFFYEGVLMRNEKCYRSAVADRDLKNGFYNFAMTISKYSEYPVCNSRSDIHERNKNCSNFVKYRWYHNGSMCTNLGFTPKYSNRNYVIRDGLMYGISSQDASKEYCVDTLSLKAEREKIEGIEVPKSPLAPVVQMPNQTTIPFKETKEKEPEWDLTNFYRVWDTIDQARIHLSTLEANAIRYYVADIMSHEMGFAPDTIFDDDVDTQMNLFLSLGVETLQTLNDMWDDKNYNDIMHYLQIAKDNPDGQYKGEDDSPADTTCEACEFVPKPTANEQSEATARKIIAEIKEAREKEKSINMENVNDVFPPENLDKEQMIDFAIASEQASVPMVDAETDYTLEETNGDAEAREYAVQDIVDYLGTVRDGGVDLVGLEDDDFAQEVASAVFNAVDPLLHRLRELCEVHQEEELFEYVSDNIKKKVKL